MCEASYVRSHLSSEEPKRLDRQKKCYKKNVTSRNTATNGESSWMLPSRVYFDTRCVTRFLKIIAQQREPREQIGRKLLAQTFSCDLRKIQRDL